MLSTALGGAALTLAACGGGGGTGAGSTPAAQGAQGTPRAAASLSGRVMWQIRGGPTYQNLANWAVGEFKKKHPNVTVETSADTTGNFEKTTAMMVSGSGPDIFHGWGRLMVQYAAKGVMVNHNDLIKDLKPADVNDFVKQQWDGLVVPTTNFRYGMPTYVNLFVLYYNKSLLQQRGQKEPTADWDHNEYANVLKAMTFEENNKKVWGGFARVDIPDRQYHVRAFGGHYVDPKDLTKTLLDQKEAQQGLEWEYARLHTDRTWAPILDAQRTWQPVAQQEGFAQGVLATLEDGMDKLQTISTKMAQANEWNIMHMPKGPAARNTLITTDSWAIWRETKAKDASWELMKFLISKEFYEEQAKIEGLLPSRKSALDAWQTVWKDKLTPSSPNFNFKVITDALTTMNYPTVDEVFLCQNEAERVLNDAIGQVITRGEKPPSYIRDVAGQVNQAAGGCGAKFQ